MRGKTIHGNVGEVKGLKVGEEVQKSDNEIEYRFWSKHQM